MYKHIPGGTMIEIPDNAFGFVYRCHLPPVGYGENVMTGKLEVVDIFKRSEDPEEQYWERVLLPHDYNEKRQREAERQKIDKKYIDPYLEDIRVIQWRRRLCGVWFWNHGELVYITGLHFLYINWWKFQGKYNSYRRPDRDSFYVTAYCIEDPFCLGENEIMNRKSGKTARAGVIEYDRTSRLANHHGGIQSKTDKDADEVFQKAIVQPWKKLPHFFRPTYDLMKGDSPGEELRFFATARRGQSALEEQDEETLDSWIDFKSSDESAYDGPELHTYISDETSKTKKDVSIIERQNVTRMCTEIGGEFVGFHYYTTTVEIDENEEEHPEFQELTAMSNPLDRDENGRTLTGLYTYFRPSYQSIFFDKFGEPDEERAKTYLLNTRKKLQEEGKLRKLSSFKRKQPMTFKEAFSVDGEKALFNPELVNEQLDFVSWNNSLTEKGDLIWEKGQQFQIEFKVNDEIKYRISQLIWVPNPNGEFEKVKGWWPKEANKVYEHNGNFLPNNSFAFRIGNDPFKYDKTKDKRRSNSVAYAYQMPDLLDPENIYNDAPCIWYDGRPDGGTRVANYAILKMCWLCGCQALIERNAGMHWKDHFIDWKCFGFLMWLPGEVEPGIHTDVKVIQMICDYSEAYINEFIKKVLSKRLMGKESGWLGFKVEDTQKYDHAMGFGLTLIAVKGKRYRKPESYAMDIDNLMPLQTCNV